MKYTIEVTQEDIDAGVREDCFNCPIARAADRVFPRFVCDVEDVRLDLCDGWRLPNMDPGPVVHSLRLPEKAAAFVECFDAGCDVEPFTFEVELDA